MTTLDALQETLADEHAAVWLYGVFGGRTSQAETPDLYAAVRQAYDVHRGRRDQLARTVRDLGAEPAAAAVAYELPTPPQSAGEIRSAALGTERRCAAAYASLVARSVGEQRQWAITALVDAAVRQLAFGGVPEAFPGLDGLAQE
jgi:hypothetical protein